MQKHLLVGTGGFAIGLAAYMWIAPQHWYDNVPGVAGTGPMNFHFALDVALAFLASGTALVWAGLKQDKSAGVCGASWLAFHALFHVWIWIHRGAPADFVALTNLLGIQLPGYLALFAAFTLHRERARQ